MGMLGTRAAGGRLGSFVSHLPLCRVLNGEDASSAVQVNSSALPECPDKKAAGSQTQRQICLKRLQRGAAI